MLLKYIYTAFVGILIAIFVGVGVSVFYSQPPMPRFPNELNFSQKEPSSDQLAVEKQYNIEQDAWNEKMKPYNRNVSVITLLIAVLLVTIGLILVEKLQMLSDGITLGGVFTLIYSLGRSFASGNSKFSFLAVTVGLVVTVALGYLRFLKPANEKS